MNYHYDVKYLVLLLIMYLILDDSGTLSGFRYSD